MAEKKSDFMKKLRENPWMAATIVLAVLIAALLIYTFVYGGGVTGNVVSESDIGTKAVSFINTQLLQGNATVTLTSVTSKSGLYEVLVSFQGREVPTYFTKDGQFFLGTQLIPAAELNVSDTSDTTAQPTPTEVPKSDKPKVELFVMSYCPYGTQAEKGILPAIKELGNSVDFNVRFVHYTMHGEKEDTENFRQMCIREEQNAKFIPYSECFLADGNATRCIAKAGIDNTNLNSCLTNKAAGYYAADSKLSQDYGVQGSPTLIINGVEAEFYPRDPNTALKLICSSFNTAPANCSKQLSTTNPTPGFGYSQPAAGSADTGAASCGTA
jgi:hypothetical protein